MRKKLLEGITLVVVALMLILPISTAVAKNPLRTINREKNLTIWVTGVNGENYSIQMEMSQEDFEELNTALDDFLNITNTTIDENSPDGKDISVSEWEDIENGVNHMIDLIKAVAGDGFPDDIIKAFILSVIEALRGPFCLWRQPLLSVGIGITWIPFYEYETFIGKLLRPIYMRHFLGFSATCRLNPFLLGFTYWHFGRERVSTFLFNGIFINFGDLGINRLIGPQILIGYGSFTGIIQ